MSNGFKDQVALITGAASGIGRATALHLAKEEVKIVVSDLNEQGGLETVQMVKEAGSDAVFIAADVADEKSVQQLFSGALHHFGKIDIGINNAGIGGAWAPTAQYNKAEFDKVIAINQTGVFLCMQAEINQMLKQGRGAIVNVSSIAGLRGLPNSVAYTASKHAVIGMTKTSALEYAKSNIRINAVCPVFTRTPMVESMFQIDPAYEEKLVKNIPMRRYGNTDDIAQAIVWLCSPLNSFFTGQALALDGGMTA
ncbi:MAG TPA: short-chain dehydrogenase [Microscillaceae bacterium]|jgi:NAD(P)-dependent dehydrogenase (short-subunit alcohol dehydrogenase family)|nr:short-chain dehydrogenase [Microscillaceae bacterium]